MAVAGDNGQGVPEGNELADVRRICAMWRDGILDAPSMLVGDGRHPGEDEACRPHHDAADEEDGIARFRLRVAH